MISSMFLKVSRLSKSEMLDLIEALVDSSVSECEDNDFALNICQKFVDVHIPVKRPRKK